MSEVLSNFEDFVKELGKPTYGQGEPLYFAAAKVAVDPMLPLDLFAYVVLPFDQDGEVCNPDGSEELPILFAINRERSGIEQVKAFLSLVLSALYRQPIRHSVTSGESRTEPGFTAQINDTDELAREDCERLVRVSQAAGNIGPITSRLKEFNQDIKFEYRQAVRSELRDIRAAMSFFRAAYNELDVVRNAIDKATSLAFSVGPRLAGGTSEAIRSFGERRLSGMGVAQMTAQSYRDAQIFGTSCLVFSYHVDVYARLVRPDKLRIEGQGKEQRVIDEVTNQSWFTSATAQSGDDAVAVLFRGVEQDHSPYGLSILEPVVSTVHKLLTAKRIAAEVVRLTSLHNRLDTRAAQLLLVTDEAKKTAETALNRLFWLPETQLEPQQSDIYFPGWEQWVP